MRLWIIGLVAVWVAGAAFGGDARGVRVLLLTGRNNHKWQATTPVIREILEKSGRFAVEVVTTPGTEMDAGWETFHPDYSKYDLVLSNYTDFGAKAAVGTKGAQTKWIEDLVAWVKGGGAFVKVHAASFEGEAEFARMVGLTWQKADFGDRLTVDDAGKVVRTAKGKGPGSGHGKKSEFLVRMWNGEHPIGAGLPATWMHAEDELWAGTRGPAENVTVLASAYAAQTKANEPVAWTVEYGKGRVFVTVLGHDVKAMGCVGFRTILARGCEWAATGKVTLGVPKDFPTEQKASVGLGETKPILAAASGKAELGWAEKAEKSLALKRNGEVLWQLNFGKDEPKPYFHPMRTVEGKDLTWNRPADHPWHLGLWFSWKFINGANYWEMDRKTGKYEGLTEVTDVKVCKGEDFSATVVLKISYHLPEKPEVLGEVRTLKMMPPRGDGTYAIDWHQVFTAGDAAVLLDRTKPRSQGGPAWGGYAGLAYRSVKTMKERVALDSNGWENTKKIMGSGKTANWIDLSGIVDEGTKTWAGVAILEHPSSLRHPTPWYVYMDGTFGAIKSSPIYAETLKLEPKQSFTLAYRVVIHSGKGEGKALEAEYRSFAESKVGE